MNPRSAPSDTVQRRLQRLVLAVLLLVVVIGSVSISATLLATRNVTRLTGGYGPANDANADALTHMLDAESAVRRFQTSPDQSDRLAFQQASSAVATSLNALSFALSRVDNHDFDRQISQERDLANQWVSEYGRPATNTVTASALNVAGAAADFDRFRDVNTAVSNQIRDVRLDLRRETRRLRERAIGVTAAASLLAILVVAALGLRTARGIARPLGALGGILDRFDSGDLGARAQEDAGPREVQTLARAVNTFGSRTQAELAVEELADDLRQRTRLVSLGFRRISDPRRMAQHLVTGLGEALGADRVVLHTFPDERVDPVTVQWHHPHLNPLPEALIDELPEAWVFTDRLWDTARIVRIADHESLGVSPGAHLLSMAAREAGFRSSVVAPIGDSNTAFGLLWVAMTKHRRDWTGAEAGIIQHLAADGAHGLIQASLLTRNREIVERLRELDQAKADFISTVSHELRTPLTSISGYLEMLADGDGGELPAEATRMLSVIDRNAVRLRNLIEDLLTQSRIDAGRLRLHIERLSVRQVCERVEASMRPLAVAAGVELVVESADSLTVDADSQQLEQVLTNLLSNAIKFSGPSETVQLSAHGGRYAANGYERIVLEVSDTGIGIPTEDLDQLTTRFFRASNAVSGAFSGTGLGLAIVAEIIERHRGTLSFESTEGKGTVVTIELPAATQSPEQ